MPSHSPSIARVQPTTARSSASRELLGPIPPQLRPLVRAYLLGYGFTVGPRVFSLLVQHLTHLLKGRPDAKAAITSSSQRAQLPLLEALAKTLKAGLQLHRFATFCAALVGGSTLLQPAVERVISRVLGNISLITRVRLARWLAAAVSAYFSIQLLQTPYRPRDRAPDDAGITKPEDNPISGPNPATPTTAPATPSLPPQAGRTLDLTLFAAARAVDVIIGELWAQRRSRLPSAPRASNSTTRTLDRLTSTLSDPLMFAVTSGLVMWNWFYAPDALPRSYNSWIASAASLDRRLKEILQRCHAGAMRYGVDTGQASLLEPMCAEYGLPVVWADPAITIPYPCELVHMGCGPSCEYHALSRFARSWLWSLKMYLPLQLMFLIPRVLSSSTSAKDLRRAILRTFLSASRSSAFLGAFISLFYYGVCLARTRIGPLLLGTSTAARQRLDSGLCVGTGCVLSGWSILLETPSRRQDLALFVVPRAVATLLPRRYGKDREWVERVVFAASTAVVFTCVQENKKRVRGVVGTVLKGVLAA